MTIKTDLLTSKVRKLVKITVFLGFLLSVTACTEIIPSCGVCNSPPLTDLNGSWELIRWNKAPEANGSIRIRSIPNGNNSKALFMNFDLANNRVNGFSGCNSFTASATDNPKGIIIGDIASTRMMCSEAKLMELENDFLYQLRDYRTLKIEKNQLLLLGRDGEALVFIRRNLK